MKLKTISITNFRCFESLQLTLEPDITVIVGANGAGKSSLLDAIAIPLYELTVPGGKKEGKRASHRATVKPEDIFMPLEGDNSSPPDFVHLRAQAFVEKLGSENDESLLEWDNYVTYTPPNNFRYSSQYADQLSGLRIYLDDLWRTFRNTPSALNSLPVVAYYRSDRSLKKAPELGNVFSAKFDREAALEQALDAGANYTAMSRWLYLIENEALRGSRGEIRNAERLFETVQTVLKEMVDGVSSVGFQGLPPKLKLLSGGRNLLLDQLSDGYRNLIGLCLDFARRLALANPNSPSPLSEPGILLIDEIELHLHPGWQQTLLPKIARTFTNTQIIATTHSPQILTTVHKRQVRVLDSDRSFVELPDDVGTYGAENSRILEQVLGISSRPDVEPVRELHDYLRLVEAGEQYAEMGRILRQKLEEALGKSDPALIRADMRIRQLEILRKKS